MGSTLRAYSNFGKGMRFSVKSFFGWFVVLVIIAFAITLWWGFHEKTVPSAAIPEDYNEDFYDEEPVTSDPKEGPTTTVASYYDPLLEYRLNRDIARDNTRLALEKLVQFGNLDASQELVNQNKKTAKEEELEGLLKAKGFGEAVITIEDDKLTVLAKNLTRETVEAIGELIFNLTSFSKEQIVLTSI